MRRLFASLFCILGCISNCEAQKITDLIHADTMVYVYKLDYEQAKFILKSNAIPDTNFLFTKKFREYPAIKYKADTLPEGNYLIARIFDKTIYYEYFYRMPLQIIPKVINEEVILFFSDKKTKKPVQNAKVEIDGMPVKYDPGFGGYSFLKKAINKDKLMKGEIFVKISYMGEVYIYQYQISEGSKPVAATNYYNNRSAELNSPGYLLLDKPYYKPSDSLNLKAFLIDYKTGNPIRKKAFLTIYEPQQKFRFSKVLKKKTPGAYLYGWKLPDSLKLDRFYQVELRYLKRGRRLVKKTSFKLEEYELAKNKYELDMPSEMFFAGDDITFFTSASDLNGFPVQGTRVHYNLRIDEVLQLFTDTLTLSAARKKNWFEKDTTIEYDKFIENKIPSHILPQANAKYTLEVTFTDPVSFEKKVFTKQFLKYTQKEKLLFYQAQDSLHVRNLYNNRDTAKSFYFFTLGGADTLSKKMISTPFHYKLNPLETAAGIIDKDSVKQNLSLQYNKLEITSVKGRRSGDSILISFKYPFAEPVHYKIYKKDKLVKSGAGNQLKFTALDQSLDDYKIILTTNLQNQIANNFYELRFVPEKDLLHFEKKIAGSALPGDSLAIEITALDFKNKPRKNVNITAYAVNAAFADDIITPQIEVPEKYKNKVSIEALSSRDAVTLRADLVNSQYEIRNHHLSRFNLRKNEYYLLKYPLNEFSEISISKQQPKPEFAVVITHRNRMYTPKYILLDGEPVFISDLQENKPFSIAATAGKHNIAFRYFDKLFTFQNTALQPGTKLLLGINIDSIKTSNSRLTMQDSLPILEPSDAEKQLLYSSLLITNMYQSDSLEILSDDLNQKRKYYQMYGIPRINIDGDNYYVDGPFKASSLLQARVYDKTFNLKTGYGDYYFYDEILKDFIPKKLGSIKGAFFHFSENELQAMALPSLLIPDTLLPQPQKAVLKYKPKTERALQIKEEEIFYQSYASEKAGETFKIIIENKSDSDYIKSAWIISNTSFESSDFIESVYRPMFVFNKKNASETFDIYLFYNKNRMAVLRNQHHTGNDEFYINATYLKKEAFTKEKIEVPLKIYTELNSTALLPFYDIPFEPAEKIKAVGNKQRSNIYLHGMITSSSQEPLSGALVYAEINGKYKYGAITNANGLFELLDMLPGTYQIKIIHPEYKIAHFAPYLLNAHTEYVLNTSLLYKETTAPLFESVYNDFRLLAYARNAQKNILKLHIYEKETRDLLSNLQIKLLSDNKIASTYQLSGNHIEIPFPLLKDPLYSIEISKPGYTTLRINGIEFKKNYVFFLEAFIGLEKKEILKQKEYDLEMEGMLADIADISTSEVSIMQGQANASVEEAEYAQYNKPLVDGPANTPPPFPNIRKDAIASGYATNDIETLNAGTYQRKSGDNISIGGDRASGAVYIVDGMRVPSGRSGNFSSANNELAYRQQREQENIYADGDMIEQVIQNKNTSAIRKKFSDVGYWKPNTITDKNGRTAFTVKLPDNITSWKSYIAGVGNKWLHGTDSAETKVYKPLQTTAQLPSYLYRQDKLFAKVRYTNLTKDSLNIVTSILIDNKEMHHKNTGIKNTYIDSVLIETTLRDTLMFEGGLIYRERYKDFEHYDIPVFSTAMKYYANQSMLMEKDSVYKLSIDPGTKGRITFNNSLFEKVVAVVNELNQYEYACVEQSSSKLLGLLLKARIQKKLLIKEKNNRDIYNMLSRMADLQNTNGSFGWWRKNGTNDRLTIYAMEVCYMALKEGYTNNVYNAAKDYIVQHYSELNESDKIYAYNVLLNAGISVSHVHVDYLKIKPDFLTTTDKIYFYQNKLKMKDSVSPKDLYAVLLEINQKAARPYYDNFFYDGRADLFKAYSLFRNTPFAKEFISLFRKKLLNGQFEKNLNTYSKAQMIEALTTDAMTDSSKPIQSTLLINDTLKVNAFPFTMNIGSTQYKIKHTGGDVFLNTSEEKWVEIPEKHDSVFGVRTYFVQHKNKTNELQAGQPCEFTVDIQAFRSGEHVMIEIPIPSGMKVTQKNSSYANGDYIEYYKHKVVYFFSKLSMGTHQYVIQMMPVFRGEFMLPATKASLMYYPFVFGNNENTKVIVK
ncbi:MAG: carboxypeptidase regulatory-like domain-containing protein [Chitinophagaceae bacterium]|nr:carboxypeptidase regulatory-like domain-containing protein [Chitinophagaceae bacterium]